MYEAIKRGVSFDVIYDITKIDKWFLAKLKKLADTELALKNGGLTEELYRKAKKQGFMDKTILRLCGLKELPFEKSVAGFKMVDTCAGLLRGQVPQMAL